MRFNRILTVPSGIAPRHDPGISKPTEPRVVVATNSPRDHSLSVVVAGPLLLSPIGTWTKYSFSLGHSTIEQSIIQSVYCSLEESSSSLAKNYL